MISNIGDQKLFDAAPSIARLILDRNGIVKRDGIGIVDAEQVSALILDVASERAENFRQAKCARLNDAALCSRFGIQRLDLGGCAAKFDNIQSTVDSNPGIEEKICCPNILVRRCQGFVAVEFVQ